MILNYDCLSIKSMNFKLSFARFCEHEQAMNILCSKHNSALNSVLNKLYTITSFNSIGYISGSLSAIFTFIDSNVQIVHFFVFKTALIINYQRPFIIGFFVHHWIFGLSFRCKHSSFTTGYNRFQLYGGDGNLTPVQAILWASVSLWSHWYTLFDTHRINRFTTLDVHLSRQIGFMRHLDSELIIFLIEC